MRNGLAAYYIDKRFTDLRTRRNIPAVIFEWWDNMRIHSDRYFDDLEFAKTKMTTQELVFLLYNLIEPSYSDFEQENEFTKFARELTLAAISNSYSVRDVPSAEYWFQKYTSTLKEELYNRNALDDVLFCEEGVYPRSPEALLQNTHQGQTLARINWQEVRNKIFEDSDTIPIEYFH